MVVPALELLLIIRPALVCGIVGIVQPVKRSLHARLHFLKAGVALVKIDLLRVEVVEKPIPDDLAHDAGNGNLCAVVADAGLADAGGHVDKMAHYMLRAGGRGAFVCKAHGKAAEGQDICKLAESLCIACRELLGVLKQSVALGADHIRGCGVEMLSHAENIAQIPVNGRCPCCNKVAVTADVHLRRSCGNDIEVNNKDKRIA